MKVLINQGHSLNNPQPMIVELRTDERLVYDTETMADGMVRPASSATCTLVAEGIDPNDARFLLDQLGLSTYQPSAPITVWLEDIHGVPAPFYGFVEFTVGNVWRGWFEDFRIRFYGLVAV